MREMIIAILVSITIFKIINLILAYRSEVKRLERIEKMLKIGNRKVIKICGYVKSAEKK